MIFAFEDKVRKAHKLDRNWNLLALDQDVWLLAPSKLKDVVDLRVTISRIFKTKPFRFVLLFDSDNIGQLRFPSLVRLCLACLPLRLSKYLSSEFIGRKDPRFESLVRLVERSIYGPGYKASLKYDTLHYDPEFCFSCVGDVLRLNLTQAWQPVSTMQYLIVYIGDDNIEDDTGRMRVLKGSKASNAIVLLKKPSLVYDKTNLILIASQIDLLIQFKPFSDASNSERKIVKVLIKSAGMSVCWLEGSLYECYLESNYLVPGLELCATVRMIDNRITELENPTVSQVCPFDKYQKGIPRGLSTCGVSLICFEVVKILRMNVQSFCRTCEVPAGLKRKCETSHLIEHSGSILLEVRVQVMHCRLLVTQDLGSFYKAGVGSKWTGFVKKEPNAVNSLSLIWYRRWDPVLDAS